MYAAEINMKSGVMGGQAGAWFLAIFLLSLAIMAWLTVRETSRYESRTAIKNLRRSRKVDFPSRELLPLHGQLRMFFLDLIRGGDITATFQDSPGDGNAIYELKLRREIDKLVGKAVYLGRKEQLKPPTKPTSD